MRNKKWQYVKTKDGSFAQLFNDQFLHMEDKYPKSLPDFQHQTTLLISSDYSGEQKNSSYLTYSFIITSLESCANWDKHRKQVRDKFLPDKRRISFKGLNDTHKRKALMPFLHAADSLEGLSFTISIKKQCKSFFEQTPPIDLSNAIFAPYTKWKSDVLEKAFFIIHSISILIAGLSNPGQNIIWFTDEDSIAANNDRIKELTSLFGWVCSNYLSFDLGHLRCGTSKCDNGYRQVEDLTAIPDLIAGAISEQLILKCTESAPNNIFWMRNGNLSDKANDITWWLADTSSNLKKILCIVEPSECGNENIFSWIHFYNQCVKS